MDLAFLEMAEDLSADGKQWMNFFFFCFAFFFVCVGGFWFTYFISTQEFSRFSSSDSVLHTTGEEWVCGCVGLSHQLGLNHNKYKLYSLELLGFSYCSFDPMSILSDADIKPVFPSFKL